MAKNTIKAIGGVLLLAQLAFPAYADTWLSRPIKLVVSQAHLARIYHALWRTRSAKACFGERQLRVLEPEFLSSPGVDALGIKVRNSGEPQFAMLANSPVTTIVDT